MIRKIAALLALLTLAACSADAVDKPGDPTSPGEVVTETAGGDEMPMLTVVADGGGSFTYSNGLWIQLGEDWAIPEDAEDMPGATLLENENAVEVVAMSDLAYLDDYEYGTTREEIDAFFASDDSFRNPSALEMTVAGLPTIATYYEMTLDEESYWLDALITIDDVDYLITVGTDDRDELNVLRDVLINGALAH